MIEMLPQKKAKCNNLMKKILDEQMFPKRLRKHICLIYETLVELMFPYKTVV